tara:strand:+ start:93 stop:500 length:408 start_codon:yes stop_codon:yes gene_type:complete
MERYLKQFQTSESLAFTFISFFVIWFFGMYYCNPPTLLADESKIAAYYDDVNNYCRFYAGISDEIAIGYGFTWSQLFWYSSQVLGLSIVFEATINIFRNKTFEIEPTSNSIIGIVSVRLIQLPIIMIGLAALAAQ